MRKIHINCDLGEGGEYDEELMPLISACNIACGGHAGDEEIIRKTIDLAIANNVEIGAHPSYPDKENFGRKSMIISEEKLEESVRNQVELVQRITAEKGVEVTHIKPHGALYNDAAKDEKIAKIILNSIRKTGSNYVLYAPYNSVISKLAKGEFKVILEAFADRNYNEDFSLVSRSKSQAVLHEKEDVFHHVFAMFSEEKMVALNGVKKDFKADTFCLHSDTKNAVEILNYLQLKLKGKNIEIKKK
ncbi:5-oxoprolinase subunit PxpA [Salegentibacter sp. F188]|uniref:5-oxoprolinase subunit PxpA n=1 Tax=Autumnicola patrickiae TaxID=3075591 RepID=A0ABU3DWT7_9FLAO|nr:5-oxoprolinase subunit PxpA [Salegentibacter sp. F188]MDT0688193.1 5-oxoprolinase subunit PxpA [Salegentibacter sp. F188]